MLDMENKVETESFVIKLKDWKKLKKKWFE